MDLHSLIQSGTYTSIFLLMIANGVVNFPSSQILYLIVGYFVGAGKLSFTYAVIAGTIGNTIGNIAAYMLVKKYERPFARKLLMMDETTFSKVHGALHETFSKRGLWWLFVGKLTPSVKAFIPVLAGMSRTPTKTTSTMFLLASFVWSYAIIYIGKTFGERVSLSSFLSVSLIIGLVIVGILYKNISKKLSNTK